MRRKAQSPNVQSLTLNYAYLALNFPCLMASEYCSAAENLSFSSLCGEAEDCTEKHAMLIAPLSKLLCRATHNHVIRQNFAQAYGKEATGKGNKLRNMPDEKR